VDIHRERALALPVSAAHGCRRDVNGGGLVFAAELTGDLVAFDAATGEVRFRHFLGGQAGGGIVTYQAGGRQFVAVASGTVSGFWRDRFPGSPTITVFALDRAQ
jgi:alcohol dehydrogenase (cytochrome c)